jgi:hypothetical protein
MPQSFAQLTLLSSKINHFYTNRNYFIDAKTLIELSFLNEGLYTRVGWKGTFFEIAPLPMIFVKFDLF